MRGYAPYDRPVASKNLTAVERAVGYTRSRHRRECLPGALSRRRRRTSPGIGDSFGGLLTSIWASATVATKDDEVYGLIHASLSPALHDRKALGAKEVIDRIDTVLTSGEEPTVLNLESLLALSCRCLRRFGVDFDRLRGKEATR